MKCPEVEARILDRVVGGRTTALAADIEEHLAGCEACRTAWREYREIWEGLGRIPAPDPGAELEAGLEGRLGAIARAMLKGAEGRGRFPGYRWVAAIIVAALVGGLSGYALAGSRGAGARQVSALEISGPTFLLLLRGDVATPAVTVEEERALVAEYAAWARELAARGQLVAAERLTDQVSVLNPSGDGVRITTGTPANGARVSGFFLIRAPGFDEATRIALGSPHVRHGGAIELRRVDGHE